MASSFILDNSVAMAWCFDDEVNEYADHTLACLTTGSEAFVPAIWPLEVANALLVAERKKRQRIPKSQEFLVLLSNLPIRVEKSSDAQRPLKEMLVLAREHQLSSYDASYLDLALRLGLPLATRDKSLRRAAEKCGVTLFAPHLEHPEKA